VTNGGGGSLTGLAVGTITYGAGATGWLSATLNTTTAPATLTLQPTTGSIVAGTYTATVPITSGVASNSPQNVSVTFTVNPPPPMIALSATSASFPIPIGQASNSLVRTVSITNSGGGSLTGLARSITFGSGSGWLTASLSTTTAPSTLTLNVASGSLAAGTYTATVAITSPVAGNSPQNVAVTYTITHSYATSVQPVWNGSCAGCHGGTPPQNLTSGAATSYANLVNQHGQQGCSTSLIYVVPGSPGSSYLKKKLDKTQTCGRFMPTGGIQSAAVRDIIRTWINDGAPNN
jgi:hypothetical protein